MPDQRYLVTARKYRPQLFGELVAQEHVTETLKNAIRLDRLAHAYLFSGPRGVGKTTAARILAKAINCTTPSEQRNDASEPCRLCDSCRSFEEGRNLNIIEIDAASNNKVDDIRELRDTVRIPPQGNRKKVYIIDEVHMLSIAAFNALLKTLEEPPPYVLFIFATTEPNKVLPTILSRCQRFDFRRIANREIVSRLQEICAAEAIKADEGSLMLIARKGDGSLRDALSVLDQSVSLCGSELRRDELIQALGVVDVDLFFEVTRNVSNGDTAAMLHLVDHIVRNGYDLQEFLSGLAEHLRNLLVARTMSDTSLIEATDSVQRRYGDEGQLFTEIDLLRLLMIVAEAEEKIRTSTQPRLRLEMALLKMANLAHAADLRRALDKLEQLESMIRSGQLPSPQTHVTSLEVPSRSGRIPANSQIQQAIKTTVREHPPGILEDTPSSSQSPQAQVTSQPGSRALPVASDIEVEAGEPVPVPGSPKSDPTKARQTIVPPDATSDVSTTYSTVFSPPALSNRKRGSSPPSGASIELNSPAVVAEPEVSLSKDNLLSHVSSCWPQFVKRVGAEKKSVGALLQHGTPSRIQGGVVFISVPDDFHRRMLDDEKLLLKKILSEQLQVTLKGIEFDISAQAKETDSGDLPSEVDPAEYMQRKREEDPVVRAIFEQFGGELMW